MPTSPKEKHGRTPAGLGRDGLERLFPHLAQRLDATPGEGRERLLVKAFLLLADAHGDIDDALWSLDEAAACGVENGRAPKPAT
jgi:hypothetical protein